MKGRFEVAPPPKEAPVHAESVDHGVHPSLRVETNIFSQWRCHQCSRMQPRDSLLVWVPDGVQLRDPDWSVTEASRTSAYNGHLSGWCMPCARKLGRTRRKTIGSLKAVTERRYTLLQKFALWLRPW